MKKTALILWAVAALCVISSVTLFIQGNAGAGAVGIVAAVVLFVVGLRKQQAAPVDKEAGRGRRASQEDRVYIEANGKKYHKDEKCSGMKAPKYITRKAAEKNGYEPCQKCAVYKDYLHVGLD